MEEYLKKLEEHPFQTTKKNLFDSLDLIQKSERKEEEKFPF